MKHCNLNATLELNCCFTVVPQSGKDLSEQWNLISNLILFSGQGKAPHESLGFLGNLARDLDLPMNHVP